MSESPVILDPSARFVDEQQEDLVDFIFRLTGDRSRAAVMGREACRLMKDELNHRSRSRLLRVGFSIGL